VKHNSHILAGKRVADVITPKAPTGKEPEPAVGLDSIFESIHQRADYVGPVLEQILLAEHTSAVWDVRV
jgi:hypothetical protein